MELEREKYETEIDGKMVDLYTIRNKNGMVVKGLTANDFEVVQMGTIVTSCP